MTSSAITLFGHDLATYRPSQLHLGERTYLETNCYTDVIIELLHARGDDPVAVLGSTVRMDFEGDQWTFFKPHPGDMEVLLGVDIHEMQLYRTLEDHIAEQLARGNTMIVELDSWFLPDTSATSYRSDHVKTSVAVEAIDPDGQRMRYYHNTSLHGLAGDDYRGALRVDGSDACLPPYAEIVRFDESRRLRGSELVDEARTILRGHLAHAPVENPFVAFGQRLEHDLPGLLTGGSGEYHDYAFATVRMVGAGFELCRTHAAWLLGSEEHVACEAFASIVDEAKLLSFKLARRKQFDPQPVVDRMAAAWSQGLEALAQGVA